MPRSECRKRIANHRNEGLENQECIGDVEGSEKRPSEVHCIAKIAIVVEQQIRQCACSLDRFACGRSPSARLTVARFSGL
jgi:hypothetical protein